MRDLLAVILAYVDTPEPLFTEYDLCRMAGVPWERFGARGFFRRAENAAYASCLSCPDGHSEEILLWRDPDGSVRSVIPCPESLFHEVPPEQIRQWTLDVERLAVSVATELGLGGRCKELVPDRLWRLGRTPWQGQRRDVLLARGLTWPDAKSLTGPIAHATRSLVLVATQVPEPEFWSGRARPVVALSEFATLRDSQLELDHEALWTAIIDRENAAPPTQSFTVDQLKELVRQQVSLDERSRLLDDAFVEAFRREGSSRKAAKWLSDQTDRTFTKDQVALAVRRQGGISAVLRDHDSDSIVRTVTSHRRGRSRQGVCKGASTEP